MELDSMVSQLCTRTGSARFPRAAAAFRGAEAPVVIPPTCTPCDGASFEADSHETHPTRVFSVPWNSEPFIWPPASRQGRWERSTTSGCNPSNLFLNAVSCEKESHWWSICHSNGAFAWTPFTNPSSPPWSEPLLAQSLNHSDRPCPFLFGMGMGCSTLSTNFWSQSRTIFTLRNVILFMHHHSSCSGLRPQRSSFLLSVFFWCLCE